MSCCAPRSSCDGTPRRWPRSAGPCPPAARSRPITCSTRARPATRRCARCGCPSCSGRHRHAAALQLHVRPERGGRMPAVHVVHRRARRGARARHPARRLRRRRPLADRAPARARPQPRLAARAPSVLVRATRSTPTTTPRARTASSIRSHTSSFAATASCATPTPPSCCSHRRTPGRVRATSTPMWPLWNVLDLTPQGRGEDWWPKLQYQH